MRVVTCNMKVAWHKLCLGEILNSIVVENGMSHLNFKGFVADNVQANWNAVRKVCE